MDAAELQGGRVEDSGASVDDLLAQLKQLSGSSQ